METMVRMMVVTATEMAVMEMGTMAMKMTVLDLDQARRTFQVEFPAEMMAVVTAGMITVLAVVDQAPRRSRLLRPLVHPTLH